MSYQALYRKYRPKDFSDVKGQGHIVKTLNNQIQAGRVGHAYLFCGTRGTGKTTVAKIFARAVNCENPGENGPCGQCAMCKALENQTSMNVIEMDAASNNKVEHIRQVIDEVQYSPAEGKYKVYIIDEVHMLTASAFNALLKTLEEPPAYLIFILATTEAHKIPLTILSRCQRYDFKRIGVETIAARLQETLEQEGIEAEEKALQYIARLADGAMRDGLSLLEQCVSFYFGQRLTYENVLKVLGAVDHSVYHELMEGLRKNQVNDIINVISRVVEQGKDLLQFTNEFIWYLRNLLVVKTAEEPGNLVDMSEENLKDMQNQAEAVDVEMIFRYIRLLSEVANDLKYENNKRVMLEVALVRLCRPQMEKDYDALVNRMHNLEEDSASLQEALESGNFSVSATQTTGEVAPPVQKKVIRPEAVPEDVRSIVGNWKQLLRRLGPVFNKMLEEVRLSVSDAGTLVMAFSQKTPVEFLNVEQNREKLIEEAGELTGKQISIEVKFVENRRDLRAYPELREIIPLVDVEFVD